MSVYLISICEITNFSQALSEYADVSAKLIEENGGRYIVRGPINKCTACGRQWKTMESIRSSVL